MRIFFVALSAVFFIFIGANFLIFPSIEKKQPLSPTKSYQRIVSLAPSYTEVVEALGQSHRLVGVTTQCHLKNITQIGNFAQANFEAIIALKPDLVLAVPHVMASSVIKMLHEQNIMVFAKQPDSLADIKNINEEVALMLDVPDIGKELNYNLDKALEDAKLFLKDKLLSLKNKNILIAVSPKPFVVAGAHTFAGEIIEACGFNNMASESLGPWPVWSLEALMLKPPKLLILAQGSEHSDSYQKLFRSLNIDISALNMTLVVPKLAIFNSPSSRLIEDTKLLVASLNEVL